MHKLASLVLVTFLTLGLAAGPARAALTCMSDQQGADDEPGQKDLSELCQEPGDGSPFELHVTWNFDNTSWNGNNTGDACVLFDTNGNGFADAALCVTTTDGPPSSQADGSPRLFACGDTRPDRCTNGVEVTNGFASTCTVNDPSEAADPFLGLASHTASKCAGTDCTTKDAFVSCLLDGDDLGGTEACVAGHCSNIPGQLCTTDGDCLPITDVCSYPSTQPNSDPSDCIITPTQQDPCQGVDCTYLDDDCNVGVCNQTTGECEADPEPVGTACGDPGSTACDAPDTCDGSGTCEPNYEPAGTLCRAAAGACDLDDYCTGDSAECVDDVLPSQTVCRAAAGDCDVPETCDGVSGLCPADQLVAAGTVCRSGSGDLCDPDEVCSGVDGSCPADTVAPGGTVCNPGSGDLCDPDEVCSGVAGQACPSDTVGAAGTLCRAGSGDVCDPDEVCSGVAGQACPSDTIAAAGTVCNPGSGDLCDPDEVCSGTPGTPCPSDSVMPAGTLCRAGSGDMCDPDERCTGVADDPCPADTVASAGTVCREATDACDVQETCSGTPGAACPADGVAGMGTVCRSASGVCDVSEVCDGVDKTCPVDQVAPQGSICRPDQGDCDVAEVCDGATKTCPTDVKEPAGTPCADEGNVCTDDYCDAFGTCEHVPNDDPCDDFDLCTAGDTCVDGRCTGAVICDPVCRTGGFWGTHGGGEKDGQNVTQGVIDAAPGGALSICGELVTSTVPIGDLDSALEGLCVSPRGSARLQLYRQLVATALNCVMSDDPGCSLVLPVYQQCNDLCALGEDGSDLTIGDCIDQLDCFNNGGRFVPGVGCATGECEEDFFLFCGGVFGGCPDVGGSPQSCVPFPDSCHEQPLCPSEDLCFEPLGPASSTTACQRARGNACTIDSCG